MKENQAKLNSELSICCININCSTNTMHALAHNIATSDHEYDIILVQEPWWNGNFTTSFQGWQVILPSPTNKEHNHPRVAAYFRLQAGIDITLRTDISTDLDFMIMDVKWEGLKHPPTHIINLYNQTEPGESQDPGYTTDRLAQVHFHPEIPTVITGNWNLHHNLWNSVIEIEATPARTQEVVDWLEGQGFNLCSEKDKHTRTGSGTQWDTTINLTFANETAFGQGLVRDHDMNPNLALLLDHHALTFKLRDPRETVNNLSKAKYNWKEAKEEDFIEVLKQTLHEDDTTFDSTI